MTPSYLIPTLKTNLKSNHHRIQAVNKQRSNGKTVYGCHSFFQEGKHFFWKQHLKSIKSFFKKFILTRNKIEMGNLCRVAFVFFFHRLEHLFLLFICNYFFLFCILSYYFFKKINKNSFSLYYIKENKLFGS